MPVADNNTRYVTLAGQKFFMERIPMKRMRQIAPRLAAIVSDVTKDFDPKDAAVVGGIVGVIIDKALEVPHELLSLFIKNLPKEIFDDEENGVTFPEFVDAFSEALEYNRLDMLKNFFTKLAPAFAQMKLPKTN